MNLLCSWLLITRCLGITRCHGRRRFSFLKQDYNDHDCHDHTGCNDQEVAKRQAAELYAKSVSVSVL